MNLSTTQLDDLCRGLCQAREAEAVMLIIFHPHPKHSEIILAEQPINNPNNYAPIAARLRRGAAQLDSLVEKEKAQS